MLKTERKLSDYFLYTKIFDTVIFYTKDGVIKVQVERGDDKTLRGLIKLYMY